VVVGEKDGACDAWIMYAGDDGVSGYEFVNRQLSSLVPVPVEPAG
jgi:hypothetical protein